MQKASYAADANCCPFSHFHWTVAVCTNSENHSHGPLLLPSHWRLPSWTISFLIEWTPFACSPPCTNLCPDQGNERRGSAPAQGVGSRLDSKVTTVAATCNIPDSPCMGNLDKGTGNSTVMIKKPKTNAHVRKQGLIRRGGTSRAK